MDGHTSTHQKRVQFSNPILGTCISNSICIEQYFQSITYLRNTLSLRFFRIFMFIHVTLYDNRISIETNCRTEWTNWNLKKRWNPFFLSHSQTHSLSESGRIFSTVWWWLNINSNKWPFEQEFGFRNDIRKTLPFNRNKK